MKMYCVNRVVRDNDCDGLYYEPDIRTGRATFGMNCFGAPEALLGVQEGAIRIRVGYAGGTILNPSAKEMYAVE